MCALLSVIAPHELGIGKQRVLRFLDSYIGLPLFLVVWFNNVLLVRADLLTRLRMHASAAYLRKYSVQELRATTKVNGLLHLQLTLDSLDWD